MYLFYYFLLLEVYHTLNLLYLIPHCFLNTADNYNLLIVSTDVTLVYKLVLKAAETDVNSNSEGAPEVLSTNCGIVWAVILQTRKTICKHMDIVLVNIACVHDITSGRCCY